MFLFAITRDPITFPFDGLSVRQFRVGSWSLTAATDGWLSSVRGDGDGVTLREVGPLAATAETTDGSPPRLLFAEVAFRAQDQSLELFKSPLAGRFFFYCSLRGCFYAQVRLQRQPPPLGAAGRGA
jgi:hypothetical protein